MLQDDSVEVGNVVDRVHQLGTVTEKLFSRLYSNLGKRANEQVTKNLAMPPSSDKKLKDIVAEREIEIERLQGVLANIDEGIIMQDTEGRIVMFNEAAQKLLGTQKNFWESELGLLFDDFRERETLESELVPLGEPTKIQVNERILGVKLAGIADQTGKRLGTVIVLRDITQDTLSERMKEGFITHISHELKTPMTVIKGMSEVLLGQPEDKPLNRRFLETLTRNVDILDRLVIELLDISEMSAGDFQIRKEPFHIESILWGAVNGLRPEALKERLEIQVMTREVSDLHVVGDQARLLWALSHLVRNAVFYTEPNGHIDVLSGLYHDTDHDRDYVLIQIEDTGVGISSKDLPHIFERFYRGEARKADGKRIDPRGLGQGLFVARTITETHGGFLGVQTEVGKGSVFTMMLPASKPDKLLQD